MALSLARVAQLLLAVLLAFAIVVHEQRRRVVWLWSFSSRVLLGANVGLGTLTRCRKEPHRRKGGLNYSSLFGCLVALKNGAQYALTIKPTGANTYTSASPSAPPQPQIRDRPRALPHSHGLSSDRIFVW